MHPLCIGFLFVALSCFWGFRAHDLGRGDVAAHDEALAANFLQFRAAAVAYAKATKAPATLTPDSPGLKLPQGWKPLRPWRAVIQDEVGGPCCYVYGEATAGERLAAGKLLGGSLGLGWNDHGLLRRRGDQSEPWMLPPFIPNGHLVALVGLGQ